MLAALPYREAMGGTTLSVRDRVACMQRIDRVYAAHRIDSGLMAQKESTVDGDYLRARVESYLLQAEALKEVFGRPLIAADIANEIQRIEHDTKDPERLQELYAALDDNPVLVGECLVRPVVTDRLIRNLYTADRKFQDISRRQAEEARSEALSGSLNAFNTTSSRTTFGASNLTVRDLETHFPGVDFKADSSVAASIRRVDGQVSVVVETAGAFELWYGVSDDAIESLSWPKRGLEEWSKSLQVRDNPSLAVIAPEAQINTDLGSGSCQIGNWTPTSYSNDFANRWGIESIYVWDGSEMLVFGPATSDPSVNPSGAGGARYDPATDTWSPMAHFNFPATQSEYFEGVWTGTELVVWGGCYFDTNQPPPFPLVCSSPTTGARYNPATDTWRGMSEVGAPDNGQTRGLTWTGSRVFAWNGSGTAALYDPVSDTWSPASGSPIAAPAVRTVWTGDEVLVFSLYGNGYAAYRPSTNTWRLLSSTGAPATIPANAKMLAWSGTEALVFAYDCGTPGGCAQLLLYRYNPTADTWTQASSSGIPTFRYDALVEWAGDRLVIWGGNTNGAYASDGGIYLPTSDVWIPTRNTGAPSGRDGPLGVWDGSHLLVWGGVCSDTSCWNGARLDVVANSWSTMAQAPSNGAPLARKNMGATGDGNYAYVWGGGGSGGFFQADNDGAIYDPVLDHWTSISSNGAPTARYGPSLGITGSSLYAFGGQDLSVGDRADGGVYDLNTQQWSAIPEPPWSVTRTEYSTALAAGSVFVWGGFDTDYDNSGFIYSVASAQWSSTTIVSAPSARGYALIAPHAGKFYVFGGVGQQFYSDISAYDPATNTWSSVPETGDIPADPNCGLTTNCYKLVDAGDYLVLWAVPSGATEPQQAWSYEVSTGIWTRSSMTGYAPDTSPSGYPPSIVWSGREVLFFGSSTTVGVDGGWIPNGWGYNPATDQWRALEATNSPDGRQFNAAVVAGAYMMIWGGGINDGFSDPTYTGALYCIDTRTGPLTADLVVSAGFEQPTISLGQIGTVRTTVINGGPDTATGIHLRIDTGTDLAFNTLGTVPAGTHCTTPTPGSSGVIDCMMNTLDDGATASAEIRVTAFATGMFHATADAQANESDPNLANNAASATLSVIDASDEIFSNAFE
jgi:N-acetylneuraminic acid mutarotase